MSDMPDVLWINVQPKYHYKEQTEYKAYPEDSATEERVEFIRVSIAENTFREVQKGDYIQIVTPVPTVDVPEDGWHHIKMDWDDVREADGTETISYAEHRKIVEDVYREAYRQGWNRVMDPPSGQVDEPYHD